MSDTSTISWSDLLCRFEDLIDCINEEMTAKEKVAEEKKPPAELSGPELDEAVAVIIGGYRTSNVYFTRHGGHLFWPSKNIYDIAFAWACKPTHGKDLRICYRGNLYIGDTQSGWAKATPLEASRIFIEQHRKDGEK